MAVYFIADGAGFVGSYLVKTILDEEKGSRVVIYNNFSSGKTLHMEGVKDNPSLTIIKAELKDRDTLINAMCGTGVIYFYEILYPYFMKNQACFAEISG